MNDGVYMQKVIDRLEKDIDLSITTGNDNDRRIKIIIDDINTIKNVTDANNTNFNDKFAKITKEHDKVADAIKDMAGYMTEHLEFSNKLFRAIVFLVVIVIFMIIWLIVVTILASGYE